MVLGVALVELGSASGFGVCGGDLGGPWMVLVFLGMVAPKGTLSIGSFPIVPPKGHYRELLYSVPKGTKKVDFCGFFGFLLSWFLKVLGGKSLFSRCLRVIGRWTILLGSFSTYFEPDPRPWGRVMSKKPF